MRQDVFKSASELDIEPSERNALICFLNDLEANAVRWFSMDSWEHCIAGQCDKLYGTDFVGKFDVRFLFDKPLLQLFCPPRLGDATQAEAAFVLRHYLMTGKCIWDRVHPVAVHPVAVYPVTDVKARDEVLERLRRSSFDRVRDAHRQLMGVVAQDAVA